MKLKEAQAPHFRYKDRTTFKSLDVLLMLAVLVGISCVFYGMRPSLLMLTTIAVSVAAETVGCLMMRRRPTVLDGTAAVTGGLIVAMMPPTAPYWLPIVAALFAVFIVKLPFGGTGRNLFNPAAGGMAFVTLCFPEQVFSYPSPSITSLPLGDASLVASAPSPASQLAAGGASYDWKTLLLGEFPGPLGTTLMVVLLSCALYLFVRRTASPWITLPYLIACLLIAWLFPRADGGWQAILTELCSGTLVFGGVFVLTDPVTSPHHWAGRAFYGFMAGVFVMLLRHTGRFEQSLCFAVLLMNAVAPMLDRLGWQFCRWARKRRHSV